MDNYFIPLMKIYLLQKSKKRSRFYMKRENLRRRTVSDIMLTKKMRFYNDGSHNKKCFCMMRSTSNLTQEKTHMNNSKYYLRSELVRLQKKVDYKSTYLRNPQRRWNHFVGRPTHILISIITKRQSTYRICTKYKPTFIQQFGHSGICL